VSEAPRNKIALSFLAHPDDAEFLCAGTLARLADAGWSVHIATATPGDCGSATMDRWEISAVRVKEAQKAASLIGATYHCLDEGDIFVVFDKPTVNKVVDLFRRVCPTLVFTHAPKDYMIDHEMVSLLARAASFAYGIPNVSEVPRPAGAVVPHLYYCDPIEAIATTRQPSVRRMAGITFLMAMSAAPRMPQVTGFMSDGHYQRA